MAAKYGQRTEFVGYWCWRADVVGAMDERGERHRSGYARLAREVGISTRTLHRFLCLMDVSATTEERCAAWALRNRVRPQSAAFVALTLLVANLSADDRDQVLGALRLVVELGFTECGISPVSLRYQPMEGGCPRDLFPSRQIRSLVADLHSSLGGRRSARHRRLPWRRLGRGEVFRLRRHVVQGVAGH